MKIWTSGCFDILHKGHIELFRYAKSLGDELVVGIDSDEKIKLDKGKKRPINDLQYRMTMLQSIKYINKVIPFDNTKELRDTVKWYRPNIIVMGSDWKNREVIGEDYAEKLIFFERVGNYSTTNMIRKK